MASDLARDKFADALLGPGLAARNVAHHLGILRDRLELEPIVRLPRRKS